jgi:hypothetical protein
MEDWRVPYKRIKRADPGINPLTLWQIGTTECSCRSLDCGQAQVRHRYCRRC